MTRFLLCLSIIGLLTCGTSSPSFAKHVVVGIYQNAPLVFTDESGQARGVFIDVFDFIAQKEGWNVEYRVGSWPECLERLQNGDIDLLAAIADSKERRQIYDYHAEPILSNWAVIYVRHNFELQSTMALTGRKLAVVKGDIYYTFFKEVIGKFRIFPQYLEVASYPEILDLLNSGQVDAGILPRIYASYHESEYRIQKTSVSFSPTALHFAALKGQHSELLGAIQHHIALLKDNKNSMYYKTLDMWIEGVHRLAFPKWLQPRIVLTALGLFIITILSGMLILRWQVRVKAKALEETISAKEKIQSELRVAHDIQMESVPRIFPPFPERQEFDIFATLEPAREVGGDFYDFFFIDDEHLCFLIGDVSGKGVPAALFMSAVKTLTKATAKHIHKPGALLAAVNSELAPENESCTFVTIFCGILNIHTGDVRYTNAGHNLPLLLRPRSPAQFIAGTKSPIVGVHEDAEFHEATLTLTPGDSLCLYTDGVTEAFSGRDTMFSEERLQQEIADYPQESMQVLVQSILQRVQNFAGDMPQTDDITILTLRYFGSGTEEPSVS